MPFFFPLRAVSKIFLLRKRRCSRRNDTLTNSLFALARRNQGTLFSLSLSLSLSLCSLYLFVLFPFLALRTSHRPYRNQREREREKRGCNQALLGASEIILLTSPFFFFKRSRFLLSTTTIALSSIPLSHRLLYLYPIIKYPHSGLTVDFVSLE